MINTVEVFLWGTKIGTLYQPENTLHVRFEYDPAFLNSHIEVAPFMMPLSEKIYAFPELPIETFQGLPGMIADSLPDRFGNEVVNQWLAKQGRKAETVTALERLCYSGKRSMGALEYAPQTGPLSSNISIDVTRMTELAESILSKKQSAIETASDATIAQIMEIGSSAGGARAKAVIAWNENTDEIRSGQIDAGEGFRYWIMKFGGLDNNGDHGVIDKKQYTQVEYAYYLMAKDCGIDMTECRLYQKDGLTHFITERFDRQNGKKVHMQSLGALTHSDFNNPGAFSYEAYALFARRLGIGKDGMEQIFIRAVFNMAAKNCDDHVKNFSFLMDRKGNWTLSPAYDLTYAYNPGNRWLSKHQMTLNGKMTDVNDVDLLQFGKEIGVSATFGKKAINRVKTVLADWPRYAEKAGVGEERMREIQKNLLTTQLSAW
jgi:serine/threonine-protein kinase HipA